MACTSKYLTSIATSCASNLPSIKSLWIGQYDSANFTYTYVQNGGQDVLDEDGNKIIEAVSGATLKEGSKPWVIFNFKKNTGELTSEMTVNDNGSHYYTNGVNLVFAKIDNSKRLSLEAVASGECTMIVLDSNNQYWLIGAENSVAMTTLSATTGVAVGDSNQYSLTISADEANMPILIEKDQAQTIINTLTTVTPGA